MWKSIKKKAKRRKKSEELYCNLTQCPYLETFLKKPEINLISDEQEARRYMFTEPQTRLPSRLKLIHDIQRSTSPVLFIINIDGFSQINDLFGIPAGDFILGYVARRLDEIISALNGFTLYKLHADEYAVFAELNTACCDNTVKVKADIPWEMIDSTAQELVDKISTDSIEIDDGHGNTYDVLVNITIGISVALVVGKENIFTRADMALRAARQRKKAFLYYKQSTEIKKQYEQNIKWAHVISTALKRDMVLPYYQPILNNKTGIIEKYESLVRLIDDDGEIVTPYFFLSISKALRLYPWITRKVVEKSFSVFRELSCDVSINVDVEDIYNPEVVSFLLESISDNKIGKRVTFEILESESIDNYDEVSRFIDAVKKHGCRIAIDDFGTGYSNFSHLLKLKIDYLKIDASLIKDVDKGKNAQTIVRTIVNFSREIGVKTIAEFVHSEEVFNYVREIGIDYSQGYYIGKPAPKLVGE